MIPNRCLLYDMNDYLWDLRGTIAVLNSYIKWLGNQYFQRRLKGSGIGFGNRSGLAVPMENVLILDKAKAELRMQNQSLSKPYALLGQSNKTDTCIFEAWSVLLMTDPIVHCRLGKFVFGLKFVSIKVIQASTDKTLWPVGRTTPCDILWLSWFSDQAIKDCKLLAQKWSSLPYTNEHVYLCHTCHLFY